MSKTIYKYGFERAGSFKIDMPAGAKVLSAFMVDGSLFMWAMVDPNKELVAKSFVIFGTGHHVPNISMNHISTFEDRMSIWHLFEVREAGAKG